MKYRNDYKYIVKLIGVKLPKTIDDNYIENRVKNENGQDAYTIEYSWGLCGQDVSKLNLSNLSEKNFRKLAFDTNTKFSKEQIEKFNPNERLEKGKNFGLGLELLHQAGINGEGINVAIIDWNFDVNNIEMLTQNGENKIKLYDNESIIEKRMKNDDGFHGKTVSSLLCGNTVGVAPNSNIYYFATNQCREDKEVIDILEKIKQLNIEGNNISAISMSSSLKDHDINDIYTKDFEKQNCAFISSTNFWKNKFNYMNRDNTSNLDDPNNFSLENPNIEGIFPRNIFELKMNEFKKEFAKLEEHIQSLYIKLENVTLEEEKEKIKVEINLKEKEKTNNSKWLDVSYEELLEAKKKRFENNIYIPCGGRTYPQIGKGYMYCGHSSASWTIPQVAGLFVLAKQLDPIITFDDFTKISKETCYKNKDGYLVINPEGIVREINELNKIKSSEDEQYKKVYENSSELIGNLDNLIKSKKGFNEELKQKTNSDVLCEKNIKAEDIDRENNNVDIENKENDLII